MLYYVAITDIIIGMGWKHVLQYGFAFPQQETLATMLPPAVVHRSPTGAFLLSWKVLTRTTKRLSGGDWGYLRRSWNLGPVALTPTVSQVRLSYSLFSYEKFAIICTVALSWIICFVLIILYVHLAFLMVCFNDITKQT